LPVPIGVTYGGDRLGAAGVGFDVPLSFVRRDLNLMHRRPAEQPGQAVTPREQVVLSLGGQMLDLVPTSTSWVARRDAPQLRVVEDTAGATWTAYDGEGLTYTFSNTLSGNSAPAGCSTNTTASTAITAAGLWLLTDISGPGGSTEHVNYCVTTPTLPDGNGLAIDLIDVNYNAHTSTAGCYKSKVALNYGNGSTPLSLVMVGNRTLTRLHTLDTINVISQADCTGTNGTTLNSYQFTYTNDQDTTLPRLQSVTMKGQAGTSEASTTLPVATYTYGTATTAGTPLKLTYQADPTFGGLTSYGQTRRNDSVPKPLDGVGYASTNPLLDLKGVGVPAKDKTLLTDTWSSTLTRFNGADGPGFANADLTWTRVMDVNGDGRLDIVNAAQQAHAWVIYLNDGTADSTLWPQRVYSTDTLAQYLRDRGIVVDANYLPLSQRRTAT